MEKIAMRPRTAVGIPLVIALAAVVSCGPKGNVQTIEVREVNGSLTASSTTLDVPSNGNPQTVRWVGPRDLQFRVEFISENPCDPQTSRLDQNPAVCNVIPGHGGAYLVRVVSQSGAPNPIIMVRVQPCNVCDFLKPTHVGIGCDHDHASATPSELVVDRGSEVSWFSVGQANPHWKVEFVDKNPCGDRSLDSDHSACSLKGDSGEYRYKVTVDGCPKPGEGKITLK